MLPISVCMITKNEEKKIERCLKSLAPYGFEIVIVDTGSTDRTPYIASQYTNTILPFHWTDDFSAARNYSLGAASHNWILMLDCDEWIESLDVEELQYFMKHLSHSAGSVTRKNYVGKPASPSIRIDYTERFYDRRRYHYTGMIHEQLTPKFGELECLLLNTTIFHDGYLMTEEERQVKAERNLTLTRKQLEQEPQNPYLYYQMGKACILAEDNIGALHWFSLGLDFPLEPELAYVQAMVISYGELLLQTGQAEKALQLQAVYDDFKDSADFVYLMGLIYRACHMYTDAVREFLRASTFSSSLKEGANSFLAWYQIAGILGVLGDNTGARQYLLKCGNYPPALQVLEVLEI